MVGSCLGMPTAFANKHQQCVPQSPGDRKLIFRTQAEDLGPEESNQINKSSNNNVLLLLI